MPQHRLGHRLVLLGLSLLSGCAAASVGAPISAGGSSPYSAYLIGRFAQDNDQPALAASHLLAALKHDPNNQTLMAQAFLACLMAGRPEAAVLAARLPGSPMSQLVLGDAAARRGDWKAAQGFFAALPGQGLTQLMSPLLVAWAQQGQADVDGALGTLQPMQGGQAFAGLYALHAALIADLGNRFGQAQTLYGAAASGYNGMNLRLARILANWEYRQGHVDDATSTMRALGSASPQLAIVVDRLVADVKTRPVRNATDGLAEVYLSFAAELRQQNNQDNAALLLRLALDLRPGVDRGAHADGRYAG